MHCVRVHAFATQLNTGATAALRILEYCWLLAAVSVVVVVAFAAATFRRNARSDRDESNAKKGEPMRTLGYYAKSVYLWPSAIKMCRQTH